MPKLCVLTYISQYDNETSGGILQLYLVNEKDKHLKECTALMFSHTQTEMYCP